MDVAPTVAALLGIRMPAHLQGHDLTEILSH
jgi:arylsulfatase A-like enzyme